MPLLNQTRLPAVLMNWTQCLSADAQREKRLKLSILGIPRSNSHWIKKNWKMRAVKCRVSFWTFTNKLSSTLGTLRADWRLLRRTWNILWRNVKHLRESRLQIIHKTTIWMLSQGSGTLTAHFSINRFSADSQAWDACLCNNCMHE